MKVIGIIGSPRKGGNTEILVEKILSGAKEAGLDVEIFKLNELNIHPCQGCNFAKKTAGANSKTTCKNI